MKKADQVDRIEAAEILGMYESMGARDRCLKGDLDMHPVVEAFARHRLNATPSRQDLREALVAEDAEGAAQWLEQMADRFEGEWPNTAKHCRFHVNSLRTAIQNATAAALRMREYLDHKPVCRLNVRMGLPCDCGFKEAHKQLAALSDTPPPDNEETEALREALRKEVINSPETADFMAGVPLEAAHQRERWGASHDAGKTPFDWFWLVGYLAQKAASSAVAGDTDKAMHHTISTAAALANWHAALTGAHTLMRPGIGPDKAAGQ